MIKNVGIFFRVRVKPNGLLRVRWFKSKEERRVAGSGTSTCRHVQGAAQKGGKFLPSS